MISSDPTVPKSSPAPAPALVNWGRQSIPLRRSEQSSSASGSVPVTSTATNCSARLIGIRRLSPMPPLERVERLGNAAADGLDGCLDAVVEVKFGEDAGDVV